MKPEAIDPFIRFAARVEYTLCRGVTKTADCRMLYILEGCGKLWLESPLSSTGMEHTIRPGLFFTFQPGTAYQIDPDPLFYAIAIDFDYTKDYTGDTEFFLPVAANAFLPQKAHHRVRFPDYESLNHAVVLEDFFSIRPMMEEIAYEQTYRKPFYQEKSALLLKSIILETLRQLNAVNKKSVLAQRLVNYICEHYAEDISNETIAAQFCYNPCYLNRIMLEATGKSLHKYVIDCRIRAATTLLLTTSYSLAEIADQTGFSCASHFCSCFKSVTGKTPAFYRK